jgi:hypothetical protein
MTPLALLLLLAAGSPLIVQPRVREGDVQAFPAFTDRSGHTIADARYTQRVEGDVLRIEARYDFPDGRTVVERAELRLHPQLEQASWSRTERDGTRDVRTYEVDFAARKAKAAHLGDKPERWEEDVEVEPGKTFAGIAFVYAIKNLRAELKPGQGVKLRAIAFTPKPRSSEVLVSRDGPDTVEMAGRKLPADRYTIHAEIPRIARLFVDPPDQHVWLHRDDPPTFIRFEGPSVEPEDPVVHIDVIPSGTAKAASRAEAPRARKE